MMKALEISARDVDMEGAEGVNIRWLISKDDGAPGFAMRLFEVAPGGHSPLHSHDWEHEVYVVDGRGELESGGDRRPFEKGWFILVPPGMEHSFINTGDGVMRFLCLVPNDSY
ncbi:MAG TPA: cupin domain-containing protein [Candidatus Eisenbacteria bacterium]|uniref:Cupin domain-containing protein n=1 Tax=Eiseniibacteriota bacterium TaxID=2212470 RepID=A0A7V2AU24_UNCEI|nr:cupin domain-containing protein [Candidatus Eisenbacteria bacterium]